MTELTFEQLSEATAGGAVALRSRLSLAPAGGAEDKVFPPSYAVDGRADHKYAVETRQINDKEVETVLLDSIASQANRAEEALLEGWLDGDLAFPVPYVDFSDAKADEEDLSEIGKLTALEAPHRIADAIFRDSLLDGTLFRLSDVGQQITNATPRDATALYRYSPTALLFGVWDSTGPKGGLGSKFQRAYVSEIIGLDVQVGKKVGSRLDPLAIEKLSAEDLIYEHADPAQVWTVNEDEAAKEKGKPKVIGRPSEINHGNIAPSIDSLSGGVTISGAVQTTVISLAALRKLRFGGRDRAKEAAAQTAIAALGVAAAAYLYEHDYDLRSRCLLIPTETQTLELVARDGSAPTVVDINRSVASDILKRAAEEAEKAGIGWETSEIRLEPSPKLIELLAKSRKAAKTEKPEAE